jgi:hypothetical protein
MLVVDTVVLEIESGIVTWVVEWEDNGFDMIAHTFFHYIYISIRSR